MGKKYTAKSSLRRLIYEQRKQFSDEERATANIKLADNVEKILSDTFSNNIGEKKLGAYYPLTNEPGGKNLLPKLEALTNHIFLPIPSADSRIMRWGKYQSAESIQSLQNGEYGIPVPSTANFPSNIIAKFNIILVPGLAFDTKGNRLGKGKGYYDTALQSVSTSSIVIGLSFDNEIFDSVPHESWDKKVDFIITPTRLLDCRV